MKIANADVPKTAFGTKYGHYEWLFMPFGLVNAPSTFQRMMTELLQEFIDDFFQVYLDGILIYSKMAKAHVQHVESVLRVLRQEELKCSGAKCLFGLREIQYVGHIIGFNCICPMEEKLSAVKAWPRPANVFNVRSFLGLCGFYRQYVKSFAHIAAPLHGWTVGVVTKRQAVVWLTTHEKAFLLLKEALVSVPVLLTPNTAEPYVMETDASDFAVGAFLLQNSDEHLLHPVAFESYPKVCTRAPLHKLVLRSAHQEIPEYSAPACWGSAGKYTGTHTHPYPAPVGRYLLEANRYPQTGAGYPQTGT
ncbi:hypothetical protein PCASD_21095 [Puccinia coronata f. sp. avenae]|uniref:Reverse transcriptase domain-containing protein n=1 Tax=Puccinia coronata f. sp. avenae TaxID=200324 RepID=A0A2N5T258_9BASI|nr:hypothetical protein PCASD_21095 [Puccinia coronata f. sp. avenae]